MVLCRPECQPGHKAGLCLVEEISGTRYKVLCRVIAAGWHNWTWNGCDRQGRAMASGLYFLRAQTGSHAVVHKMSLIK